MEKYQETARKAAHAQIVRLGYDYEATAPYVALAEIIWRLAALRRLAGK